VSCAFSLVATVRVGRPSGRRVTPSNGDPFVFIERQLILAAVVEPRGLGRLAAAHPLGEEVFLATLEHDLDKILRRPKTGLN
jgi:hypothetical protein